MKHVNSYHALLFLIVLNLIGCTLASNGKEVVGGERSADDVENVIALVNKQTDEKMLKTCSEPLVSTKKS